MLSVHFDARDFTGDAIEEGRVSSSRAKRENDKKNDFSVPKKNEHVFTSSTVVIPLVYPLRLALRRYVATSIVGAVLRLY